MNENMETITREMLTDKIDHSYIGLQKGLNEDAGLFAYRKESMGYIHDALYNAPIPDELLRTAYGREDILREAYLFWTEKASRGDTAVDKEGLAADCARLWLEDVRNEYRHNLLCERIAAEHAEYMAEERLKTPDEIIEDAWKITCYNDLMMKIGYEEMDTRDIDALLTLRYPLANVYDEVLQRDMSDHMNDLMDAVTDIAQLQRENIVDGHLPESAVDAQHVSEYLEHHGAALPGEEAERDEGIEP